MAVSGDGTLSITDLRTLKVGTCFTVSLCLRCVPCKIRDH